MIEPDSGRTLVETSDGSKTLFVPHLDEHYHSIHGAIQEALHVFIEAGLEYFLKKYQPDTIRIFEMGFGTGLNAALTAYGTKNLPVMVHYHTVEAHPLTLTEIQALNYFEEENDRQDIFMKLHQSEWNKPIQITKNFILEKNEGYIEHIHLPDEIDIVYFDAFAPSAQPHLWEETIFQKIFSSMTERGILVTYCAKGSVKRTMKTVGWNIEKLPGPPGKREMTRAFV